jgi:Flp pilus assembly pilin Flp
MPSYPVSPAPTVSPDPPSKDALSEVPRQAGATSTEYAVLLVLVALLLGGAAGVFGLRVTQVFGSSSSRIVQEEAPGGETDDGDGKGGGKGPPAVPPDDPDHPGMGPKGP